MNNTGASQLPDPGPTPRLRAALDALPRERALAPDAWTQLQSAIEHDTPSGATPSIPRRSVARWMAIGGIAAVLAVAVRVMTARDVRRERQDPFAELSIEERNDPRVLALIDQTRRWYAAADDSLRSARWPHAARVAVNGALDSSNRAVRATRAVLARNPDDEMAREALVVLREQQRALLQHAMSLLDDM